MTSAYVSDESPRARSDPEGRTRWLAARVRWLLSRLPPGALVVGAGFVLAGVGAYLFLALASRALSPAQYAPLASLWSLTFLLWPGAFTLLERETAKRLSAHGDGIRSTEPLRQMAHFAILQLAVLVTAVVLARNHLSHTAFGGDRWLVFDLALAGPAIALQYLAWGVLAGQRRFRSYSGLGAAEGITKALLAVVLIAAGIRSAAPLGFVLAIAPVVAVATVIPALRRCDLRAAPRHGRSTPASLLWLLGSFIALASLINIGPLLVHILGPHEPAVVTGRLLSALVVVRIPLFVYNAAATALMPMLSASASQQRWGDFRQALNRLISMVAAVGVTAVLCSFVVGPSVMGLMFGSRYELGAGYLALFAVTSSLMILATTLSVAMTALGAARAMFFSWLGGIVTLAACCLVRWPVVPRIELALLVGSLVPVIAMAYAIYFLVPKPDRPVDDQWVITG